MAGVTVPAGAASVPADGDELSGGGALGGPAPVDSSEELASGDAGAAGACAAGVGTARSSAASGTEGWLDSTPAGVVASAAGADAAFGTLAGAAAVAEAIAALKAGSLEVRPLQEYF